MLICIDGMDGAGKTSFSKILCEQLKKREIFRELVLEAEPTPGKYGLLAREEIGKRIPDARKTVDYLLRDRRDHCVGVLGPNLQVLGRCVLLDRYYYSTVCYQSGDEFSPQQLADMQSEFCKPDISFILTLEPEVAMERIVARGKPLDGYETLDHLRRTKANFSNMQVYFPEDNIIFLDASKPLEELVNEAMDCIEKIS
ncbi:dTMP kinase [Primorskyibacter sp. S187A]|uniref:dTMP kinase n=1 Tax=Primorskyibacter sp. S187A TaxID=3415130 RepID=UPI003C7B6E5D